MNVDDDGLHDTAKIDRYAGSDILTAVSKRTALCLACSTGWKNRAVGFVGVSDGWQDLYHHQELTWQYELAENGSVALTGEVDMEAGPEFTIAIGLSTKVEEAAEMSLESLGRGFEPTWRAYCQEWRNWWRQLSKPGSRSKTVSRAFRNSVSILRIHEDKEFPGGRVASLSVPWGNVQKQTHEGGYHLVWVRDCSQSALGLLASGARMDALRTLRYLSLVQLPDGSWPQAMWLNGAAHLKAIQIDSIAAALLLYEIARQEGVLVGEHEPQRYWMMVKQAARFIFNNGPVTQQDRWERNSGFSVYTLSLAIAAFVIAAEAADFNGEPALAAYLLETADCWNGMIDKWTYCQGGELSKEFHVSGYYPRIIPADKCGRPELHRPYPLENSQINPRAIASQVVSPDVWALVRYGLRSPADKKIAETTVIIDSQLKRVLPWGPSWRRYTFDGYGETEEGDAFTTVGIGRLWPLLTGERAHYELARGNKEESQRLLEGLQLLAHPTGLLPEQVWDADSLPEKKLFFGKPSCSACPLAWAHAEHLQLIRSLLDDRIFNCPEIVAARYIRDKRSSRHTPWREDLRTTHLIAGTSLRIESCRPFFISWQWEEKGGKQSSVPSPVHGYYADLPTNGVVSGKLTFTLHDPDADMGEAESHQVYAASRDW